MSFRTVVIKSRCKLSYSINYLVCKTAEDEKRILLDEIKMIIVHSIQVSITTALIVECLKKKIKIIFADRKQNLVGEATPYFNNYYQNRKLKIQLSFRPNIKDYLWDEIVKAKIFNQARILKKCSKEQEYETLTKYIDEVIDGDCSNREGHTARLYFASLFGKDFSRDDSFNVINKYLNYGYTILLSCLNRTIRALGYYTEIGIHHIGESNQFNLSCDLIEPLRPLVDSFIVNSKVNADNFKDIFINMLSTKVKYNEKEMHLNTAIEDYVEDLLSFLETGEVSKIHFINYEI